MGNPHGVWPGLSSLWPAPAGTPPNSIKLRHLNGVIFVFIDLYFIACIDFS
jgi:hypothetical protein